MIGFKRASQIRKSSPGALEAPRLEINTFRQRIDTELTGFRGFSQMVNPSWELDAPRPATINFIKRRNMERIGFRGVAQIGKSSSGAFEATRPWGKRDMARV